MKRFLLAAALCVSFSAITTAQQNPADAPATKEDIQRYLDVTHSKEIVAKMIDAMSKPMHQMTHERYLRDKDKLPADFEARMNKMRDEWIKNLPLGEMLEATVPVYQKHFTKGDVDALVGFYSTPTGQKILRELPEITAEAMQNMMPIMRKSIESIHQRLQEEIAAMLKDSASPNQKPVQKND